MCEDLDSIPDTARKNNNGNKRIIKNGTYDRTGRSVFQTAGSGATCYSTCCHFAISLGS